MKLYLIFAAVLALCLDGCNGPTVTSETGPFLPSLGRIEYPLDSGGSWTYNSSTTIFNFRPLIPGAVSPDTVIRWTTSIRSLGRETLHDTIHAWRFHGVEMRDITYEVDNFYTTQKDTLFLLAYTGVIEAFPKRRVPYFISFRGRRFESIPEFIRAFDLGLLTERPAAMTDTFFEQRPPKVWVYPLRPGLEWNVRESGNPWRIGKKVIGQELVLTPAGFFPATRIQWFWDLNNRGTWDTTLIGFEDVGVRGLVRRSILWKDFALTGSSPDSIFGYFDVETDNVLTSTNTP